MNRAVRKQDVIAIAHRGAHEDAPENTMASYERAIDLGMDYVEIDMRRTKDNRYVSVHNSTVDARTDGTGRVDSLTLEELRLLDAGSWFAAEFIGERIPTIEEVLTLLHGKIGAYVDVKAAPPDVVVHYLREYDMLETAVVYAEYDELEAMKRIEPRIRPLPEYPGSPEAVAPLVERLQTEQIAVSSRRWITDEVISACLAAGVNVYADMMAIDNPEGWQMALDLGIRGIQTDIPSGLLDFLGRC